MLISLILIIIAGIFGYLGNKKMDRNPPTPDLATTQDDPTGPQPFVDLLTTPSSMSYVNDRDALDAAERLARHLKNQANPFPHRLSNTTLPLNALQKKDTAILLRNAFIDTEFGQALPIPEALKAHPDTPNRIVQARGPVTDAFRSALADAGADIVAYIPNNAFLVRVTSENVQSLMAHHTVQSVLPFDTYYKFSNDLLSKAAEGDALNDPSKMVLTLFPGQEEGIRSKLETLDVQVASVDSSPFGPIWVVESNPDNWIEIVSMDEVQGVETWHPRALLNDRSRVRMGISTNSSISTENRFGLTGSNIWVNINDSGVDGEHPDLQGRVFGDTGNPLVDRVGHGTHVAATIAGDGSVSDSVSADIPGSAPDADFRGKAPEVRLFSMPVDLLTGPETSDNYLQTTAAATNYMTLGRTNAMVSNNSWAYVGANEYTIAAASYDAAVRDALLGESGEQPLIYVFAAGNDGFGTETGLGGESSSIPAPATGKNVITVGALESARMITNEVVTSNELGDSFTNRTFFFQSDSSNQVASYSSRGNVGVGLEGEAGRFKPDVVAPGSFVISARSSDWNNPTNLISPRVNRIQDQIVPPNAQNDYNLFIPTNALSLRVMVVPNNRSTEPFPDVPIYVAYDRFPDAPAPEDFAGNTEITIPPDGPELRSGDLRYSILNPTFNQLNFDLVTILTVTNANGNYFEELQGLNDDLAPYYRFESGTSMAAPSVTGLLALMQELFERNQESYSPALMKALLINGSRSVNSIYDFEVRQRINHQGWGMPYLPNLMTEDMFTNEKSPLQFFDQSPSRAVATGQKYEYLLRLEEESVGNFPLRISLVWTDPPGNPAAAIKLVNDLDLVVSNTVTHEVFYGNNMEDGNDFTLSVGTNQPPVLDNVNNVENVFIREPLGTNDFVISVVGRRVNVNAVTAHPNNVVQDYALVVSSGNLSLTNAFELVDSRNPGGRVSPPTAAPPVTERRPVHGITNGVPVLEQRVGAHSPLLGRTFGAQAPFPNNGMTNQWRFYAFTNFFETNDLSGGINGDTNSVGNTNMANAPTTTLTNGTNVAIITFIPPNLSKPRNRDADIDLYVSFDPGLTNLTSASLNSAFKSLKQGGTEVITFTNAPVGQDAVFYVGVKAEDQQAAEFGLVILSSDEPFEQTDPFGNRIIRGQPGFLPIPDGSPSLPGGGYMFGVGITPGIVANATITTTIEHENIGDLVGNVSHNGNFVVLNNHFLGGFGGQTLFNFSYDDSNSGASLSSGPTDSPGQLTQFIGEESSGLWLLTMTDNALGNEGTVLDYSVIISPVTELDEEEIEVTVQPNRFAIFSLDIPTDANELEVFISRLTGDLDVFLKKGDPPTVVDYDKRGSFTPPGGSLVLSTNDVPPISAGRWFIGAFNPNAVPVDFNLNIDLERNLGDAFSKDFELEDSLSLKDDARTTSITKVDDARPITDVKVGLRVNHPRISDLEFRLQSPSGNSVLLAEARGGAVANRLGADNVENTFQHVALSYNKVLGIAQLYLDGEKVGEKELGSFIPDTAGRVFFGFKPVTNNVEEFFAGAIDEIDIYDRPLGASEIRSLQLFGREGKSDLGLLGYWPLDGNGTDLAERGFCCPNPMILSNVTYFPGRFGSAAFFRFSADTPWGGSTSLGVIERPAGLGVGGLNGFTIDAWISPTDLTQPRPIVTWSSRDGDFGVEFGLIPSTNAAGGLLWANIRDVNGEDHTIQMDQTAELNTNRTGTNFTYAVFTDNTNIATGPIKFASPPFGRTASQETTFLGGFESGDVPPRGALTLDEGDNFNRWTITSNQVVVVNDPLTAHTGTNVLMLLDGSIQMDIDTDPGKSYEIRFFHQKQPLPQGLVSWWPGDSNTADVVGGHNLAFQDPAAATYLQGVRNQGFFILPGGHLTAPDDGSLSFTNAFSIELWFNNMNPGSTAPLFGKTDSDAGAINYAASLDPIFGLTTWFLDPAFNFDQALRTAPAPSVNEFHHYVATFEQVAPSVVQVTAYLDGAISGTTQLLGNLSDAANNAPFVLGANSVAGGEFIGVIDEPAVYNQALSPEDVIRLYGLGAFGKCPEPCEASGVIEIGNFASSPFNAGDIWTSHTVSFAATEDVTRISVSAQETGVMLDSFSVTESSALYYLPEEPLKPLIGELGLGDWTLEVVDRRAGQGNNAIIMPELLSWQLELTFAPTNFPAVVLTNGIPYTNQFSAGARAYFLVDVPRTANFSTNQVIADFPVNLHFNQNGLPTGNAVSGTDALLLAGVTGGESIISTTNGTFQLDVDGNVVNPSSTPVLVPGQRYFLSLENVSTNHSPYRIRVNFDSLDTNIVGLINLGRNQVISTNIAATNTLQYYRYTVNTNSTSALFETFQSDGDINMYIRKAQLVPDPLPTPGVFDHASELSGTGDESVLVDINTFPPLTPGDYYIGVANFDINPVNYSIRVVETTSGGGGITVLQNNVPVNVTVPSTGTLDAFFQFTIGTSSQAALFELYDMTGDLDLYVERDQLPDFNVGIPTFFSLNSGLINEQVVVRTNATTLVSLEGDWYLGVVNLTGADVDFTVRAQSSSTGMLASGDPLRFSVTDIPNVGLSFTWNSVSGETYQIQSSSDLVTWDMIQEIVPSGSRTSFTVRSVSQDPTRFYRIVQIP